MGSKRRELLPTGRPAAAVVAALLLGVALALAMEWAGQQQHPANIQLFQLAGLRYGRHSRVFEGTAAKVDAVGTRSLVFDSAWGRAALKALQAWRSSLFLRMVDIYSYQEYNQTRYGIKFFPHRVEPVGWKRYDIAQAFATCPYGQLERIKQFDGGKLICLENMLLDEPGCQIFSMGSKGNYNFERAMLEKTKCDIHTFDCTYNGTSLDGNKRHFYHKICLGRSTRTVQIKPGKFYEYWNYTTVVERLGVRKRLPLLKIDIEGFEFDHLGAWVEEGSCNLPLQISIEMHYQAHVFWSRNRDVSLAEMSTWFMHFANLGYAIVSKEDNWKCEHCVEYTYVRVEQPAGCPVLTEQ